MMEFWNEAITNASWGKLKDLNAEIRFVLIGGWATYTYTGLNKSKDIDIIVDYGELEELNRKYNLHKNDILRKYEVKLPSFDIDVHLPHYSKLAVPPEDILKSLTVSIGGFLLPRIDVLIALKIAAFLSRKDSAKGKKDEVDVIGLLLNENLSIKLLKETLIKYEHEDYLDIIKGFLRTRDTDVLSYLNTNVHAFSKEGKRLLGAMKNGIKK